MSRAHSHLATSVLVLASLSTLAAGCAFAVGAEPPPTGAPEGQDDRGDRVDDGPAPGLAPVPEQDPNAPAVVPLALDRCDEPDHAGKAWTTTTSTHFAIHVLPDTAAERDRDAILGRLEAAYADIHGTLGLTAEPIISVHLSPNRVAAAAHERGVGTAFPAEHRYEVIYTGEPDSFEVLRYGHHLTTVLDHHLDPKHAARHPLLRAGLAAYLDQSGRDLHQAYARQLLAGLEHRIALARFEASDLTAGNPGRAGSLVQFLVERHGMPAFLAVYRATAIAATDGSTKGSTDGCAALATTGCIDSPEALTTLLDAALKETVREDWATVQAAWQATVHAALVRADVNLPAADVAEIEQLVAVMDAAVTTDSALLYRTTLEGFYCDLGGEARRAQIAERAVAAYATTQSQVVSLIATGTQHFATAQIVVRRAPPKGVPTFETLQLEHVPAGWRVAHGPDWQ